MVVSLLAVTKPIVKLLVPKIAERAYTWFTKSKYNDYEKELIDILESTIERFMKIHPVIPHKENFIQSQELLSSIIQYRLFKDIEIKSLIDKINSDPNSQPVTSEEIVSFLEIFSEELGKSANLERLNIANNYQEEIFRIMPKLQRMEEMAKETNELVKALYNSLKANTQIQDALIEEWSKDLEEINDLLEEFKTNTALTRIENLEKRVAQRQVSLENTFGGNLAYLKASCKTDLSLNELRKDESALYINAARLCPENVQYQVQAAVSFYLIDQPQKSKEIADLILTKQPNNVGAWVCLCYLQGDKAPEYLKNIPDEVKNSNIFKVYLAYWLLTKRIVPHIGELIQINLDVVLTKDQIPETISSTNKAYWITVASYIQQKLFFKYPTIVSTGPVDEMYEDELYPVVKELYSKIALAFEGSELESKYAAYIFTDKYFSYMEAAHLKGVPLIEKVFEKIHNPNYVEVIQMAQVYNSTKENDYLEKAAEVLRNFKDQKLEIVALFRVHNYLLQKRTNESIAVFKNYIDAIETIDDRILYNIFQYFELLNRTDKQKFDEVIECVRKQRFGSASLKELYDFFHPTKELTELSDDVAFLILDRLAREFPNTSNFSFHIGELLRVWGFYDRCAEYLKSIINAKSMSPSVVTYCQALYHGKGDKIELLGILEETRLLKYGNKYLFKYEIDLRFNLREYSNIINISEEAFNIFPQEEFFLEQFFKSANEIQDVESIKRIAPRIEGRKFNHEQLGVFIASVFLRMQMFQEGIDILYDLAITTSNPIVRQAYFHEIAMFQQNVFKEFTTVKEDTYVKYKVQDYIKTVHITSSNSKLSPFKEMLDKKKNETFSFGPALSSSTENGKVLRIMNKYLALFDQISDEANNPGSGYTMQAINVGENATGADIQKALVDKVGHHGSIDEDHRKKYFEKYYRGEISFSELSFGVFQRSALDTYFYLINQGDCFRAIPVRKASVDFSKQTCFVLDFTSLFLFYQLNTELKLKFDRKFILSKHVSIEIDRHLAEAKLIPEEGMKVDINLDGIKSIIPNKLYIKSRIEFLNNLKEWIKENCEIDSVPEKLNFLEEQRSELSQDDAMMYFSDNKLMLERNNFVLLTNDFVYFTISSGRNDKIYSPESYLQFLFPTLENEIARFMLQKNYIGIGINWELIQEEFMNQLAGKPNKFPLAIENLGQIWNPNSKHIEESVLFVKWVYLTPHIAQIRDTIALTVFVNIIRGTSVENVDLIRDHIEKHFKLLGLLLDKVKTALVNALELLNKRG